jgi:hypothetical protein
MAHPTIDSRVTQLEIGHYAEEDSIFCLSQVDRYETADPEVAEKISELLGGRLAASEDGVTMACNMPLCSREIVPATAESGRKISGECFAASYCLKKTFEDVAKAPTVEEGQERYRAILDNLDGFASKYSAGNLCPRLSCELSAGLSVDMVPGTAGACETKGLEHQPALPVTD